MDKLQMIMRQLTQIVGESNLLVADDARLHYGKDLTKNYQPDPLAVVLPQNVEQVVAIVKLANETLTPLVASGGRTGISGGAVAKQQELVVAFDKMNAILDFNAADRIVTCQAGVITKALQDFALQQGLFYPVDFASSGSSQIGGNIATNAGGIKVVRYGMTRHWVAGLKVVTGNGDLLCLNRGLVKNNAGYDLRQLFIGSEGTLGFIVEAEMKLATPTISDKVMLLAVDNKEYLIEILNIFQSRVTLSAFEFFSEAALRYVIAKSGMSHPFSTPANFYALLEYDAGVQEDDLKALAAAELCLTRKFAADIIVSESISQAKSIWCYREGISMALLDRSPYKYDMSVLPSRVFDFIEATDALFKKSYPDFEIIWFGHMGDGNLHINILRPLALDVTKFFDQCESISPEVYGLLQKFGGSIAAEHGVGLLKKPFLQFSCSEAEVYYMRAIKNIFDSNGIMNPGKII